MNSRETTSAILAGGILALSAGHLLATNQPECFGESNLFSEAACGLGFDQESTADATTATTLSPDVPLSQNTTPPQQTSDTSPPSADDDPFDIGWYTDPLSGHTLMVIDGQFPVNYQHDPQWTWPESTVYGGGCMCGDNVYASGIEYLTGQFTNPVEVYARLESAGGHEADGCGGVISDRALVANLYGLNAHTFGSIYEAEQYAINQNPDVFVIIGQDSPDTDSFSPYGSHIVGLVYDLEFGMWRAVDPNDYYKNDTMLTKEPEMADNLRFWTSDQISPGVYSVHGMTNPAGRQPGPWET